MTGTLKNDQSLSHNTGTKGHFMKLLPFIFRTNGR